MEKKESSGLKNQQIVLLQKIKEGYNLPENFFEIEIEKASEKRSIATVLDLQQLTGNRFESFYVETDEVRGGNTISSLEQLLKNPLKPYGKLLFSGFTGSGKTTELVKLYYKLQNDFNVIIFSAFSRLKIEELDIDSILFEIVEDALNYLLANNLVEENDKELKDIIDKITHWLSETRIIESKDKGEEKKLGAGIDLLKGIFFRAKIESTSRSSNKTESCRIEERKINDLIFECNKLFDYIKKETRKNTLIIIDDLEKMKFSKAREFFKENSSFIEKFRCKMILTIPVELIFHADFSIIENVYGEAEVLPMIKVKDKDGKKYPPGLDILQKILGKRIDLSLFEDDCYKDAIKYSGGAIRELFRIIQRAALIENSEVISCRSMQRSIDYYKDIFSSRVQERNDEIVIKFSEYLDVLIDIYNGNKTTPERNMALLDLLRTRAVMKYNGKGFYDTHPLLDDFIRAYKKKKQKNGQEKQG